MAASGETDLIAGKYELLELVGGGGMAEVWRGLMHGTAGFSRPVAIKRILRRLLSQPSFVAMFVEEARVGSQLLHSNIVQTYDFEIDVDGTYLLVMEWVEGLDLRRYLSTFSNLGQRSPWPLVAAIAVETLRGLSAAHERVDAQGQRAPVIHRDVTPQNILLGTDGIVKLSDFGLARAMDRSRMTNPDIIKGKLAYLAPEVAYGQSASVKSDIFSLGVVLWEALAGRSLYAGTTDIEVLIKARDVEVPPLGAFRQDLPEELIAAIDQALAKDPGARYPSAREFLRTLTGILRRVDQPTDSYALSHSVIEAREVVGSPPPVIEQARRSPPPMVAPAMGAPRRQPPPLPISLQHRIAEEEAAAGDRPGAARAAAVAAPTAPGPTRRGATRSGTVAPPRPGAEPPPPPDDATPLPRDIDPTARSVTPPSHDDAADGSAMAAAKPDRDEATPPPAPGSASDYSKRISARDKALAKLARSRGKSLSTQEIADLLSLEPEPKKR